MRPSAAWVLPAEPSAVSPLRRRAVEFGSRAGASDEVTQAMALAVSETVSETVTNAVVYAYDGETAGAARRVRVSCHVNGERFIVEVVDEGVGLGPSRDSSGVGHGLAMVGALVQRLDIAPGPARRGTAVTIAFGPVPGRSSASSPRLCAVTSRSRPGAPCGAVGWRWRAVRTLRGAPTSAWWPHRLERSDTRGR